MSGFAFGFKSDDIDDEDGVDENNDGPRSLPAAVEKQRLCETKLHTVHEMVSQINFPPQSHLSGLDSSGR